MKMPTMDLFVVHSLSSIEVIKFITLKLIDNAYPINRETISETIRSHLWAGGSCYLDKKYESKLKDFESNNKDLKDIEERAQRIARKFYPELFENLETLSVTFLKSEV